MVLTQVRGKLHTMVPMKDATPARDLRSFFFFGGLGPLSWPPETRLLPSSMHSSGGRDGRQGEGGPNILFHGRPWGVLRRDRRESGIQYCGNAQILNPSMTAAVCQAALIGSPVALALGLQVGGKRNHDPLTRDDQRREETWAQEDRLA